MATLQDRLTAAFQAVGGDIKALLGRSLPTGGTTGQVLTKTSASDYATSWQTPSAGGGSFSGDPALIPYSAAVPYPLASGKIFDQAFTGTSAGTTAQTAGSAVGALVVLNVATRISAFGLNVTTAASAGTNETYYHIYEAAAGSMYPDARIFSSPVLTNFNSTGHKTQALDMVLEPYKAYWFFAHFGGNPTITTLAVGAQHPHGPVSVSSTNYYTTYFISRAISSPMVTPFGSTTPANSGSAPSWRFVAY